MDVFGVWSVASARALEAALVAAGIGVKVVGSAEDLEKTPEGLLIDAALLLQHVEAVAARRAAVAPVFFPVLAVVPADADAQYLRRILTIADESIREPVDPVALTGRVRVLATLRRCSLDARERLVPRRLGMEALGRLAAGIAAELNTPVQYMAGNLEFLANTFGRVVEVLDRLSSVALEGAAQGEEGCLAATLADLFQDAELRFLLEETPSAIRESREGLDRITSLVGAMLRVAQPDLESAEMLDLAEAIQDIVVVTRSRWAYLADVEMDLEPALPPVSFARSDFNQVLLRVMQNAIEAIEAKGGKTGTKEIIRIHAARQGDTVEVVLSDTGGGIPETIRPRVFDPFFTTKIKRKASGQGLAIVQALMARHKGRVDIVSSPEAGTTVLLTLPLMPPSAIGA